MTLWRVITVVLVAALAALAQGAAAHADSFTWDTTQSVSSNGGVLGPFTSNGQSIYAVGYQITGGTTAAAKMNDTVVGATAVEYTGSCCGIGVTDSGENGSSPGHTVSNEATSSGQQITDMVAFALPGNGYYPTSITLNQYCANGNASGASSCAAVGSTGFDDVSIFIGGTAGNLPTGATTLAQLVSTYGFTQVSTANLVTGNSLNGSGDRTINLNGSLSGAYLIIAASLSDGTGTPDYFKIAALSATPSPGAPTRVPEPSTLAILAVCLAALAVARARRRIFAPSRHAMAVARG
jgi:hypothetical protein